MKKELTVRDVENELKRNGDIKTEANFIAPDGAFIAKSTKIHHLLHIPYFVMKIDGHREYNVMSEKSFSLRNQKFTLNAHEKRMFDTCRQLNIRDQNGVDLSRFASQFEEELLGQDVEHGAVAKDVWTQNEILILIREVLAEKASNAKEEREILE